MPVSVPAAPPVDPIKAATIRVLDAWTVPGPGVGHHRKAMEDLRENWPALGRALDTLAVVSGRELP